MKILKTFSISLLLATAFCNFSLVAANNFGLYKYSELPAKTVCFKNPAAVDANKFFSETTVLAFEVYKAGSKEEITKIISILKKSTNVESVTEGKLTGDYQAITMILKSAKNKAWFATEFKKAGLNTIRINNNPVVEVDKM